MNGLTVYDQMNKESGEVYYSSSKSSELRNTWQLYRQKEKAKMTKRISTPEFSGELSTAIMLQRSDRELIKIISCIPDSYYISLERLFSCDSDNVLCIDATFNLWSSWVTDCCYNNDHLKTNEGKHLLFLGPAIAYFKKGHVSVKPLLKCWLTNQLLVT